MRFVIHFIYVLHTYIVPLSPTGLKVTVWVNKSNTQINVPLIMHRCTQNSERIL